MNKFLFLLFVLFFISFFPATAQKKISVKKYPSLFWEISGNGLKKPSYLFGTMHVSSKMVFHLSDSFYHAMRNTDAVALELNPEVWQDEMFRLQRAQVNLSKFSLSHMNDFINENTFKLQRYEDRIKRALAEEPTIVNNLLYRTYQPTADFEENTYLDLYIYQTGRKLGKRPAGVENYLESEKLMMEAFKDMAKDKNNKYENTDGENIFEVQNKIQQAYRNGDLDLLDSLQNLSVNSVAFYEKFLYLRNEIQANSIDTIIRNHSLFVSVGAAHLPGKRGVIELLRKKGYHLRPIYMQDRDAAQKEEIDKLKVPVTFKTVFTPDDAIQLKLPGDFYKREDAKMNDSWQFADMNNGSYYMLTRVRTHAGMWGHSPGVVYAKVDSMLYENIPGKILKKTNIVKNGYQGFDITNRTRRGDLQRYQVFITPYEVLVFKMSGNENYVDGYEAEQFFNSVKLKDYSTVSWIDYAPVQGGFGVKFPSEPSCSFTKHTAEGTEAWNYECLDNKTGNAYSICTVSLYNFNFISEDTFDLSLAEESIKSSEIIQKEISRKQGIENNKPFLEVVFALKDNMFLCARIFIKGTHYYVLTVRSKYTNGDVQRFFRSFHFKDFQYPGAEFFEDSMLNIKVMTAVKPNIDTMLRSWMEKSSEDDLLNDNTYSGWPKNKTGIFQNDSTGERILVSVRTFPKYYYSRDSARFWKEKLEEDNLNDIVLSQKHFFRMNDSACGYNVVLTDTNSSRCIRHKYLLKGHNFYKFSTITDTSEVQSSFINTFFSTVQPLKSTDTFSVFHDKVNEFFTDYYSQDSAISKQAGQAIPSIYFGKNGVEKLLNAIHKCTLGSKDYFETKSKLITELGYLNDSASNDKLVVALKGIYEKSGDTSYFQNPVLGALANLKTASSFRLLKDLLIQDPPVFDNEDDYERIFNQFSDTLSLARILFPDILQLAALQDYKPYINGLLRSLSDSGFIKGETYENYYSTLYFDAKIELKKQQNKDEKQLQEAIDNDDNHEYSKAAYSSVYKSNMNSGSSSALDEYAVLLMPFYNTHSAVPKFFDKLLKSRDEAVQLSAIRVLLSGEKKISDSLLQTLAQKDRYRVQLYNLLNKSGKIKLFPARYKTQEYIAKSLLINERNFKDFAEIQLVKKVTAKMNAQKGYVYFFRYKIKKQDEWKIGICGLQPLNEKQINTDGLLVSLSNKTIKTATPETDQFEQQLKRMLFEKNKSSANFYDHNSWDLGNNYND